MAAFTVKYWQAAFLLFLIHLPLLWFFEGEFTDGVLQTVYFDDPLYVCSEGGGSARYVPPLYPGLIWIFSHFGIPPLLAGRLISLISYSLTTWILAQAGFGLACGLGLPAKKELPIPHDNLTAEGIGWMTGAAWAFSPMANRWALHAMTDMTFCLFTTLSLACYLLATVKKTLPWEDQGHSRIPSRSHLFWGGTIAGVLSLWTRYQGMALLGAGLVSWFLLRRNHHNGGQDKPHGEGETALPGTRSLAEHLLLWGLSFLLIRRGLGIHADQFSQRSVYEFSLYRDFAMAAFRYLPYATTPPLLFLALYGIYRVSRCRGNASIWVLAGLTAGVLGLCVQTSFLSFQFRYGLPFLPWLSLLAVLGAVGFNQFITRSLLGVTGIWLLAMTTAVLVYQHETFADIYRISRRVPGFIQTGQQVWACEEYNSLFKNIKTSVWSGISIKWLDQKTLPEMKEGDLVIEPNVYPLPPMLRGELRRKWRLDRIDEAESETCPLFPGEVLIVQMDLGNGPMMIRATSQPELLAYRYQPQIYYTHLYRVKALE